MKKEIFRGFILFYLSFVFITGFLSDTYAEPLTEEALLLDAVVVTATRVEIPRKEAASSVTVIDGKTIEEKHYRSVFEVLRDVPGLHITQSGGAGGTTSAYLRGGASSHTLVLIDGAQVNSPTSGAYNFSDLTAENIERIEVIRGPQSTLYGSDAIGGIIHIITKKGQGPPTFSVSFEGGSFGSHRETFQLTGSSEHGDYTFSAARFDTDGISKAREKNGNPEKDNYKNTSFSARIGRSLSHNVRLEWTARFSDASTEIDAGSFADDLNGLQNTRSLATSFNLISAVTDWWNQKLQFSLQRDKLQGIDPDTSFGNFEIDTEGQRLDWQNNLQLGSHNLLTLGYEYESQEGKNKGGFDRRFYNNAFYALNRLKVQAIVLNLGLRMDDSSRFENEITYKAEAAYLAASTGGKIYAAYGTGFHAPTLNDLFFPGFGNLNLKAEESRSFELGVEQAFLWKKVQVSASYFQTQIDELIIFVFNPVTFAGMPENVAEAKINGLEISVSFAPSKMLSISTHYTLSDTKNLVTGKWLNSRPKHKANGSINLQPTSDLRFDLDVLYIGKRFNELAHNVPVGGYTLVHLSGSIRLSERTQLFSKIENLFDREYEEATGYGTAGFGAYGGIKMNF